MGVFTSVFKHPGAEKWRIPCVDKGLEQAPGWRLGDRRAREILTYGLPRHQGQGAPGGTELDEAW